LSSFSLITMLGTTIEQYVEYKSNTSFTSVTWNRGSVTMKGYECGLTAYVTKKYDKEHGLFVFDVGDTRYLKEGRRRKTMKGILHEMLGMPEEDLKAMTLCSLRARPSIV